MVIISLSLPTLLYRARYVAESAAVEYEEYKKCYLKQAKEHTGCLKEYSFLKVGLMREGTMTYSLKS